MTGLQTQFAYKIVALAGGDDCLLILATHSLHPCIHGEIGAFHDQLMPLFCEVVAYGLVLGAHRGQFDGGVCEVQIGVLQLCQHRLGTVGDLLPVGRRPFQQITGKGCRQRQFAASLWTAEHHGMWQMAFFNHLYQSLLRLFLTDYLTEFHQAYRLFNSLTTSHTLSTAETV